MYMMYIQMSLKIFRIIHGLSWDMHEAGCWTLFAERTTSLICPFFLLSKGFWLWPRAMWIVSNDIWRKFCIHTLFPKIWKTTSQNILRKGTVHCSDEGNGGSVYRWGLPLRAQLLIDNSWALSGWSQRRTELWFPSAEVCTQPILNISFENDGISAIQVD